MSLFQQFQLLTEIEPTTQRTFKDMFIILRENAMNEYISTTYTKLFKIT